MYPEPTKLAIDSILSEDVEYTCSHPQPPSAGGHGGHGGRICHGGRSGQRRVTMEGRHRGRK